MPASPPSDTIAKIAEADAYTAEDAVIDMAATAMRNARSLGKPSLGPVAPIYDDRVKRQARRLLISAVLHLYALDALFERLILGSMSCYDMAGADDEALAEILDSMAEAARDEASECRERLKEPFA